jgi:hypothetical protein
VKPDQRLRALLSQHGVTEVAVNGVASWEAFKIFGREVMNQEDVGLLFQAGTYTFSGEPLFYFDAVAQFEIKDDEGEHDHFEQTHCELTGPPSSTLQETKCKLWSFDFATADAFYEAVEALPEFKLAVQHSPYNLNAYHEEV